MARGFSCQPQIPLARRCTGVKIASGTARDVVSSGAVEAADADPGEMWVSKLFAAKHNAVEGAKEVVDLALRPPAARLSSRTTSSNGCTGTCGRAPSTRPAPTSCTMSSPRPPSASQPITGSGTSGLFRTGIRPEMAGHDVAAARPHWPRRRVGTSADVRGLRAARMEPASIRQVGRTRRLAALDAAQAAATGSTAATATIRMMR